MREILFRGKRLLNGEFVYGYYTVAGENHYILTGRYDLTTHSHPSFECYEVDAKTIGQYAWLNDRNGNKVFDGDIIRICGGYNDGLIAVIKFGEYDNPFRSDNLGGHIGFYAKWQKNEDLMRKDLIYLPKNEYYEVIGNVYDNPDLITAKKGADA